MTEPPEVRDIELHRRPPFVSIEKRPRSKRAYLADAVAGAIIALLVIVGVSAGYVPDSSLLYIAGVFGGVMFGHGLTSYAMYDDAYDA